MKSVFSIQVPGMLSDPEMILVTFKYLYKPTTIVLISLVVKHNSTDVNKCSIASFENQAITVSRWGMYTHTQLHIHSRIYTNILIHTCRLIDVALMQCTLAHTYKHIFNIVDTLICDSKNWHMKKGFLPCTRTVKEVRNEMLKKNSIF